MQAVPVFKKVGRHFQSATGGAVLAALVGTLIFWAPSAAYNLAVLICPDVGQTTIVFYSLGPLWSIAVPGWAATVYLSWLGLHAPHHS